MTLINFEGIENIVAHKYKHTEIMFRKFIEKIMKIIVRNRLDQLCRTVLFQQIGFFQFLIQILLVVLK